MSDCTQHESGHRSDKACVECEVPQLARNHYFTGKLLVERDFNDEQRYFVGKDRRHNRYLHGHGTVCGLKVVEHPNPACRSKYVIVQPGYAIDCCGREIIVRRDETFDFRSRVEEILLASAPEPTEGTEKKPDDKPHTLQICLKYRECGDEEIPALFDECGCDDGGCQPNRILESFELDVLVDPEPAKKDEGAGLTLEWKNTIAVSFVRRVVLDEAGKRLWVLGDYPKSAGVVRSKIFVFNLENFSPVSVTEVDFQIDFDLSRDGKQLYLGGQTEIAIHDAATFTAGSVPLDTIAVTSPVIELTASVDHTFFAIIKGKVVSWDGTSVSGINIATDPRSLAVTGDGKWVFVAEASEKKVLMIDTAKLTDPPVKFDVPAPWRLAVTTTTDGMRLALADEATGRLNLFRVKPGDVKPFEPMGDPYPLPLVQFPPDLAFSPGGRWVYALAAHESKLIAVDAHAIELEKPRAPRTVDIGLWPRSLAQRADGHQLFVGFNGIAVSGPDPDENTPPAGGVAVIDVTEEDCRAIFDHIIEPCPECDADECLVLATIDDYVFGDSVGEADIDNLRDRPLLPSTSVITEVVECILEHGGTGTAGKQGPPGTNGADGKDGVNGKDGKDGIDGVDGTNGKAGTDGKDGTDGTDGKDGIDGKDAIPLDLPRIVAMNWVHDQTYDPRAGEWKKLGEQGLVIAFEKSRPVLAETLPRSIELLFRRSERDDRYPINVLHCWCSIPGVVEGVNIEDPQCGKRPVPIDRVITAGPVTGARFRPVDFNLKPIHEPLPMGEYIVLIYGDQILGDKEIVLDGKKFHPALDANHLAPYLSGMPAVPALGMRCPTGNRTEGGTFRSWFQGGVNLNEADFKEIAVIVGNENIARAIVDHRAQNGRINAIDDLAQVRGIGAATLARLRESTTLG